MINAEPYNISVSRQKINQHCKDHIFLRHIREAKAAKDGVDINAEEALKKFMNRESIFWHGTYTVPPELLEETFDPIRRMQELFFTQYNRFIRMLNHEGQDDSILKETRQLGQELRDLLTQLWKMTGDVSDDSIVKEAAITMMLIKVIDNVPLSARQELISVLQATESLENLR
jgi:hypothetical protein